MIVLKVVEIILLLLGLALVLYYPLGVVHVILSLVRLAVMYLLLGLEIQALAQNVLKVPLLLFPTVLRLVIVQQRMLIDNVLLGMKTPLATDLLKLLWRV